jgi:L,D-transpeptidase catalytic domain
LGPSWVRIPPPPSDLAVVMSNLACALASAPGAVSTLDDRRVITPEQLAGALERLDPRERELLALSLRRRVPDEALARVYEVLPQEVARRRAAAIERLADELGAQRGEDLGAVLQALLDEGSWRATVSTSNGDSTLEQEREPAAAAGPAEAQGGGRRSATVAFVLGSFAAAMIGGAAAFVGLSEWGGDDGGTSRAAEPPGEGTKHFVPQLGGPFEAPFPSEPQPIDCYSIAAVDGKTTLYRKPGQEVRIKLSARTEWNSPRILGVVRRRGGWISVQAPELANGEVAWMPANRARIDCVRWSLHVDLSRRRLSVERDGEIVRRFDVAVGRKGNPTPHGRFSVTDKLKVTDPGSPYGCCVLALTGHQTRLPASWPGGDRLAVHATKELSSIGRAASLGCMRVTSTQARWLIRTIPLGTPLFVRA